MVTEWYSVKLFMFNVSTQGQFPSGRGHSFSHSVKNSVSSTGDMKVSCIFKKFTLTFRYLKIFRV